VNIASPNDCISGVYQCLSQRRGLIFSEDHVVGTPLVNMKGYLPVAESFGYNAHLKSLTSGAAFPQSVFDHWETIEHDPLEVSSIANKIMMNIRKRKGLKVEIPTITDYIDKN
jgi:elongation factor 2